MDHQIHEAPEGLVDVGVVYYCDPSLRSLTRKVLLHLPDLLEALEIALRRPPVAARLEVRAVEVRVLDDQHRLDDEAVPRELGAEHAGRDVHALDDERGALLAG